MNIKTNKHFLYILSPINCTASYNMGYYCDMDEEGCYDTQYCDLSYYDLYGCGMCMEESRFEMYNIIYFAMFF